MFWMNLHFSEDDSRGDDDYYCGHNPTGKECGLQRRGSRYVRSVRSGAKVSPAYWRHRR